MTIFQKGGSTHAPLTLLVTRVVLLHKAYGVSNPLIPQLYIDEFGKSKNSIKFKKGQS